MLKIFFLLSVIFVKIFGQVPSFGRCPDFDAMPAFDKDQFLGIWYETERYFTVTEVVSKCISANYELRADGKIYVNNHYVNRINNVKRIISGKLTLTGKGDEGKFTIKYDTFPISYDASLVVLDTDYRNYAVIWSCSNIGPFGHTESAWLMARDRVPRGEVLQAAYGVLDKYKMNRSFFVKTDQANCETLPPPVEAIDVEVKKGEVKQEPENSTEKTVEVNTVSTEKVSGQIPAFGRCPNKYKPMKDFNKYQFMGKWYEVERFYLMRDIIAKCVAVTFERFDDGKIYVNNVYTNRLLVENILYKETIAGKFKLTSGENRGIFNIRYERFPAALLPDFLSFVNFNTTMTVLHTDYKNFAILWSCRNINQFAHIERSWLMTREQSPSELVIQSAYGFLDKFGLRNYFIKSDQSNCDP
ncbi:CLUMA_CG014076, isoform A [Clunio marinus]|uniref:CLUMA_CG014076, isoform A n=1 Tax=Clunio marinus TaxID=568069 RepID=A0A1J1IQQ4_9DIPT|nr:CLUMA_CG014076, isoform A [Clunio marinus]